MSEVPKGVYITEENADNPRYGLGAQFTESIAYYASNTFFKKMAEFSRGGSDYSEFTYVPATKTRRPTNAGYLVSKDRAFVIHLHDADQDGQPDHASFRYKQTDDGGKTRYVYAYNTAPDYKGANPFNSVPLLSDVLKHASQYGIQLETDGAGATTRQDLIEYLDRYRQENLSLLVDQGSSQELSAFNRIYEEAVAGRITPESEKHMHAALDQMRDHDVRLGNGELASMRKFVAHLALGS